MSLSFDRLTGALFRGGLLTSAELEATMAQLQGQGKSGSADELVNCLHEKKVLTAYQISAMRAGRFDDLIFGNYVVLDRLGAGGMGTVYKARHRRMKRVVAIKVLPRDKMRSAALVARFQREVETIAQLSHPNIVIAYDADECDAGPFLVMEYVPGYDLEQLVQNKGPLSMALGVDHVLQVARAMEYAHSQGIVHRDIKPANMLRNAAGTVKVTDLGLARLLSAFERNAENRSGLTLDGVISGTVDFMSPEQAFSTRLADHRSDIYSLGCSLFYLLTGQATYGGETIMEKLLAHREQPVRSLRACLPGVPAELDRIFERMTAKQAAHRYQSMTDVIVDLEACALPQGASESAAPGEAAPAESSPTSWQSGTSLTLTDLSVLLVEPSRLQSRVIGGQLQDLDIRRVQTVSAGQSALDAMLATRPDLVISSMHLPDMTGAELVQSMRRNPNLRDIAFVLISSETDYDYLEPVRQAGTAAILPKPFDRDGLKRALTAAVDFFSRDAVRVHNLNMAPLQVLIVDDSGAARRHIRRVLENLGIRSIAEAISVHEAFGLLRQQSYDLVVCDYNMPEIDGPTLVREIRSHTAHQHTPVLMITSESDPARLNLAREAGVSALCSKVFDPQTVCGILERIITKQA